MHTCHAARCKLMQSHLFCWCLLFVYNSQYSPHSWPHSHFTLEPCKPHVSRTITCSWESSVRRWSFSIKRPSVESSIGSRKMSRLLTVICRRPCELSRRACSGYFLSFCTHYVFYLHFKFRWRRFSDKWWKEWVMSACECDWFRS